MITRGDAQLAAQAAAAEENNEVQHKRRDQPWRFETRKRIQVPTSSIASSAGNARRL